MSRFLIVGIVITLVVYVVSQLPASSPAKHPELDQAGVRKAVSILQPLLNPDTAEAARFQELIQTAEEAVQQLDDHSYAANMLRQAIRDARTAGDKTKATDDLLSAIKRVHESLTFRPLMEADMPSGFPPFTPLHKVELKTYPVYRMARVKMKPAKSRENNAFLSLFKHIKRNQIEMTVPVQIDYSKSGEGAGEASMTFLYRTPGLGNIGVDREDPDVEVLEMTKHTVVSIGVRGKMTNESVNAAKKKLLIWVKQNADDYEHDGPLRRMGYNSPFIPTARQFFEVQFPVRAKNGKPDDSVVR